MSFWQHFVELLPGVLGMKPGHAFTLGHTASLPTCDASRRGEERLVHGGAGVADRKVVCRKTAADVYGWGELATPVGNVLMGTATWNPANQTSGTFQGTDITVTGAAVGDPTICALSSVTNLNGYMQHGSVKTTNTVRFELHNNTGFTNDLDEGTVRCYVFKA